MAAFGQRLLEVHADLQPDLRTRRTVSPWRSMSSSLPRRPGSEPRLVVEIDQRTLPPSRRARDGQIPVQLVGADEGQQPGGAVAALRAVRREGAAAWRRPPPGRARGTASGSRRAGGPAATAPRRDETPGAASRDSGPGTDGPSPRSPLQIPERHAGEEVERRVVRVMVGRMRDEDPRRPEIPQDRLEVGEDLLPLERRSRTEGGGIGDGAGAGEPAAVRRARAPVGAPDVEGAVVRVAEEAEVPGRRPPAPPPPPAPRAGGPRPSPARRGATAPAACGRRGTTTRCCRRGSGRPPARAAPGAPPRAGPRPLPAPRRPDGGRAPGCGRSPEGRPVRWPRREGPPPAGRARVRQPAKSRIKARVASRCLKGGCTNRTIFIRNLVEIVTARPRDTRDSSDNRDHNETNDRKSSVLFCALESLTSFLISRISSRLNPASRSTSAVCSPRAGAEEAGAARSPSKRNGAATVGSAP